MTLATGSQNYRVLNLAANLFSGKIPASLSNRSLLSAIELSYNSFTGPVPTTFNNLQLLRFLNLAENQLSGRLEFLSPLANCKHLTSLYIGNNQFKSSLPVAVGNLSRNLQVLYIANCQLNGNIPSAIGNLSGLNNLDLSSNGFSGEIPTSISNLRNLQRLHLQNNLLNGSIPKELFLLRHLGQLHLEENMISGAMPESISNGTGLQEISLAANLLSLTVPSAIWRLTDLVLFNLSYNSLVGVIPAEVGNMKLVQVMDFSANKFSGNIPSTLGNLQMLTNLNLSSNSFPGPIPESFGGLLNLISMNLSSNALAGSIPKSFSRLRYLVSLNLSYNKLEGEIPQGGIFNHLTASSFIGNLALCGASKFGVPPCMATPIPNSRSRKYLLEILLPTAFAILSACFLIIFMIRRKKIKKISTVDQLAVNNHRRISYHELVRATDDFDDTNLLGSGSFGSVYKGRLDDGMLIAVKVLNLQLQKASASFDAECQVLSTVRHRNLVKIISTCSTLEFKALILQYMPNGSLEKWLYSHIHYLDLIQRINIMTDVALALEYLHHQCPTPAVHCDLKPSNILIDEDMSAHVSDFGIAKLISEDDSCSILTSAPGTIGYIAPGTSLQNC